MSFVVKIKLIKIENWTWYEKNIDFIFRPYCPALVLPKPYSMNREHNYFEGRTNMLIFWWWLHTWDQKLAFTKEEMQSQTQTHTHTHSKYIQKLTCKWGHVPVLLKIICLFCIETQDSVRGHSVRWKVVISIQLHAINCLCVDHDSTHFRVNSKQNTALPLTQLVLTLNTRWRACEFVCERQSETELSEINASHMTFWSRKITDMLGS